MDLPYYAAHPPVYYSHIIPRPYGYCPYAYLPGVVAPDRVATPLRITNPYVTQPPDSETSETGHVARRQGRQPRLVFPMAAAEP